MAMDSQSAATPPPGGASSDPVPAPEAEVDQSTYASVFLATFSTVFLAELGDKTQLAALLLSAESGRPVIVFFGASLALICSSLVGVLLGRWLARFIPAQLLRGPPQVGSYRLAPLYPRSPVACTTPYVTPYTSLVRRQLGPNEGLCAPPNMGQNPSI